MSLMPLSGNLTLQIIGAVFLLVLSAWMGIMFIWLLRRDTRTKKLRTRLGITGGNRKQQVMLKMKESEEASYESVANAR